MYVGTAFFFLLLCFYLNSQHTKRSRADDTEDSEIARHIRRLDRQDRRAALLAPWRQPWPWWFLGSGLAFAGLCVVSGLAQWGKPDALVLLIGGALFLLAFAFKAWAQEQALAPQARLLVRLARLWQRGTRA